MNEFVASSLPRILTRAQWEPRKVDSIAAQLKALAPGGGEGGSGWRDKGCECCDLCCAGCRRTTSCSPPPPAFAATPRIRNLTRSKVSARTHTPMQMQRTPYTANYCPLCGAPDGAFHASGGEAAAGGG